MLTVYLSCVHPEGNSTDHRASHGYSHVTLCVTERHFMAHMLQKQHLRTQRHGRSVFCLSVCLSGVGGEGLVLPDIPLSR